MSKFVWKKEGKTVRQDVTIITYFCASILSYTIESRKRKIPHANGYGGTWEHTSYFVMKDGKDIREFQTMKDAKDYVEDL